MPDIPGQGTDCRIRAPAPRILLHAGPPVASGEIELGLDLFGMGMAQLIEDDQRLLPDSSRRGGIARRVVRVAETDERLGLLVAVAHGAPPLEGLLVAGDRLGVMAEVVMGVAEAAPGIGVAGPVVKLAV